MKKRIDRAGEIGYNNYGTKMVITKCVSAKEIYVELQDDYKFIAKIFPIGNQQVDHNNNNEYWDMPF